MPLGVNDWHLYEGFDMKSSLVALIITFVFAFVFRGVIHPRLRELLTPWVFAIYVFCACAYRFVLTPAPLHFLIIIVYYLSIAFLLNGFRMRSLWRNKVMWAFVPFILYQFFAFRWGMYTKACTYQWIYVLLYSYAPGYCVATWIMEREDGMARLLKPMAWAVSLLALVFLAFGALKGDFSADRRVALGSSYGESGNLNVNAIALIMDFVIMWIMAFLPMAFQLRLSVRRRLNVLLKVMFAFGSFVTIVVLLKTGSRNGFLALVPAVYYMTFCFKGISVVKKIGMMTFLLLAMAAMVIVGGSNVSQLRVFNYEADMKGDITNGRSAFHLRVIDGLRSDEKIWGIGSLVGDFDIDLLGMANGHSVYFQILVQTGYIGSVLFVFGFLCMCVMLFFRHPVDSVNWRALGLAFVCAWVFTGIGESVNYMNDLPSPKAAFGFALAICGQPYVLRCRRVRMMNCRGPSMI